MTYTDIVCLLFVLNVYTVVVSATNSTNCVDATFINCNDSHVCHDDNLKTYCPLTCGLCKPCKDQAVFACSKNVCSFPSLKKFCPVTCSSCGEGVLGCTYKSKHYQQSERWEDGCDYKCTCLNADQGLYRCTERCVHYQNVPTTCRLVQDPDDQCCKIPKCDVQVVHQNTTVQKTGCLYKGQLYSQGQKWSDGCVYDCECVDGPTGHYRCRDKCVNWQNHPTTCTLVQDPNDQCCKVSLCDVQVVHQNTTVQQTGCLYNGKLYSQGQKWSDGCDYDCECVDGPTGHYRCRDKCVHYQNVPTTCRLVTDPDDQCCKIPKCDVQVGHQNTTVQKTGCLYKGQVYSQDQQWSDGCEYDCVCIDGPTGHYRCQAKCPTYSQIPQNCPLVKTPDGCCYEPNC